MPTQGRHSAQTPSDLQVVTWLGTDIARNMPRWKAFIQQHDALSLNRQPEWLTVLASGLRHEPYCVEATVQDRIVGLLPLAYVNSFLFGKFLVSLPYINTAGIVADNETTAAALIDQAVALPTGCG